ncbi:MAG: hypothetical protein U0O25_00090 [Succinivibrio sp.]|uniref:hypothetical protein n=1 Tax=Succinivibrio sp. TaxID=2053619 RepID=UPI002F953EB8
MYIVENGIPKKIEETTFSDLNMKESDLEEMLRQNVDMLCEEEVSMIIVGQQVRNEKNGRSDLTAIDNDGNIVLIEIKRDKKDIEHRKEAFEFQAIRYAANCASIKEIDELIQNVFAPYVEKHKDEFHSKYDRSLTSIEIAQREVKSFISANGNPQFNRKQRIMLVASDFDDQTLSAVAWLNSNNVDISCYQVLPLQMENKTLIDIKKILPLEDYDDYYVKIANSTVTSYSKRESSDITKRSLPKIEKLMEWEIVKAGDQIKAKNKDDTATLMSDGKVKINKTNEITTMQQWLKPLYGWPSIQTYVFAIDVKTGKSLSELRAEYMESHQE